MKDKEKLQAAPIKKMPMDKKNTSWGDRHRAGISKVKKAK